MRPPDWLSRCSGFLLAVSLLAALWVGGQRIQVERAQRGVAMLVPYADVVAVAQAQRTAPYRVLAALRQAGCTGLLVREDTLSDLSRRALCSVSASSAFREEGDLLTCENVLRLRLPEGPTAQRVQANLERKRPGIILSDRTVGDQRFLEVNASRSLIDAMGLGFDPRLAQASRDLGLRLAVELRNYPGITPEGIAFTLQQAKQAGADLVLFRGGEVLGYQDLLPAAAQALLRPEERHGVRSLLYGTVEFRPLKGEPSFLREVEPALVRVHSVPPEETERLGPALAAARSLRAVKERNVRALLVRLFVSNRQDLLRFNAEFVERIGQGLHAAGYGIEALSVGPRPGRAAKGSRPTVINPHSSTLTHQSSLINPHSSGSLSAWPDLSTPPSLLFLASLGVWAALSLLLGFLHGSPPLRVVLVVSGAALGAVLLWTEETLGRQALALAAACLFPAYAVSFLLRPNPREGEGRGTGEQGSEGAKEWGNRGARETRRHPDTQTRTLGTLGTLGTSEGTSGTSAGEKATAPAWPGLGHALAVLGKVSLVSLSGGLIIAALLADRRFMLQVEQFRGVKVSLVLPLLWMGLAGAARWGEPGEGSPRDPETTRRETTDNGPRDHGTTDPESGVSGPVVRGQWSPQGGPWSVVVWSLRLALRRVLSGGNLLLLLFLAGGLLLWLLRSGNGGFLPGSLTELRLRAWLDEIFLARPRFKEMLLGYPALVLLAATQGCRPTAALSPRWQLVLLVAAGVGQVSLVNSFCHAHTPLAVSLLRTFHGLWMGTVVGLGMWGLGLAFLRARGLNKVPLWSAEASASALWSAEASASADQDDRDRGPELSLLRAGGWKRAPDD